MKRYSAPKAETGALPGDGKGTQGIQLPGGPTRQPNLGTSGRGQLAPRPQTSKSQYMSQSSATAPVQAGMARVKNRPSHPGGSFLPVQNNANANLTGQAIGQPNPNTGAAATAKPKRKGLGSAFFGEY